MELNVRCVVLLAVGLCSTLLLTTVAAHQEEEPIMELAEDMGVEDELEDLGLGEELLDGEVEPEDADTPPGPPPAPKVTYKAPEPMGEHFFAESFDRGTLDSWVLSKAKKEDIDEDIAKYDGKWEVEDMKDSKLPGDKGLVLKSRAKHHAISAQLLRPFIFDTKPLIVQYEVNFQQGIDCGGAYVKLLSQTPDLNLDEFVDKTPYTIMFGPDKCGEDYKLHFIFRHKNPKTGEYEEKHAKKPDADLRTYYTDKKTHLYTLVVNPDNSFEVLVDQTVVNSGNLLTDMTPPINPAAEIEDPDDHKPEDWDERPKIQDPDAVKPEDWDEDMDGEWEAPQIPNALCETAPGCGAWQRPMIDNPNYKGKWKAPMIDNPNYQGVWKPRKIANPDFFEDLHPFRMTPFNAVGLELWSMSSDIFFDNFFITNERHTAERWANDGWGLKKAAEGAAEPGLVNQMMTAADERPWLWVVYVLTVAVPLILIIVFFCTGKKAVAPAAADYKKTDEPQPDVKEEEEEKAEEDQVKEEKSQPAAAGKKSDAEDSPAEKEGEGEEEEEEEEEVLGSTLFIKNLNFTTTEETLRETFSKCGTLKTCTISKKKDKTGQLLSMGYGFVTYRTQKAAEKAIRQLQHCSLDEHQLELKVSERATKSAVVSRKKQAEGKQTSSKILVRNVPFQATVREIRELFCTFGELKTVRLPKKASGTGTGAHRGFGFVDFLTKQDAKKAFSALCHSTHLYGRRLVLEWADAEDTLETLRRKTAEHFHDIPKKKRKAEVMEGIMETMEAGGTEDD